MEFIVDIQCFKTAYNDFVVKELAIAPLGDDTHPIVYLFEPPHDWNFLATRYKCENTWLTNNYHGIQWQDGEVPYDEFEGILRSTVRGARKIHVKGLEKVRWLENIIPKVSNIEALGCPSLKKLRNKDDSSCSNHDSDICGDASCAARNVIAIKIWLLDFYDAPAYSMYQETKKENEKFDFLQ